MATTTAAIAQKREYTSLERALYGKHPVTGTSLRDALVTIFASENKADSFIVEVFNQARKVPDLERCTIDSIRFHLLRAAQLDLNPALPNEVFFIPRNTKQPDGKTWLLELGLQYGYGGLRKLIMRSPDVLDCLTKEVCTNDLFEPPSTPILLPRHQLPGGFVPRGRVIGYYAAAQVRGGNWRTVLMSVADVESHAQRYGGDKLGPAWNKGIRPRLEEGLCSFDKMGLKTCLRMLCNGRDVPLTAEVQQAMQLEEVEEKPLMAAEYQGYARDGSRPALTMGAGVTMDELLQDVSGASDKEAVAVTIERSTRGTTKKREETEKASTSVKGETLAPGTTVGTHPSPQRIQDDSEGIPDDMDPDTGEVFDERRSAVLDREDTPGME